MSKQKKWPILALIGLILLCGALSILIYLKTTNVKFVKTPELTSSHILIGGTALFSLLLLVKIFNTYKNFLNDFHFQKILLQCSTLFLKEGDQNEILENTLSLLCHCNGISQAVLFKNGTSSSGKLYCKARIEAHSPKLKRQIDTINFSKKWTYSPAAISWKENFVKDNETYTASQNFTSLIKEETQHKELQSLLLFPILKGDTWCGTIGIGKIRIQREWRHGEIRNLRMATELIGNFLLLRENQAIAEEDNKMKAIGELAGGIGHDFNNILGGTLGAAEILETYITPEDPNIINNKQKNSITNSQSEEKKEMNTMLQIIKEDSLHGTEMIAELLEYAQKKPISGTQIEIHKTLRDTIRVIKTKIDSKIKIHTNLASSRCFIQAGESQLQSIFLNLALQASHAMPEGGDLTFSTQLITLSPMVCYNNAFYLEPGNYLDIFIKDTGKPIAPEHIKNIFEPFFLSKKISRGAGLGLALAAIYGNIHQLGGAITVKNSTTNDTCFRVRLPLI